MRQLLLFVIKIKMKERDRRRVYILHVYHDESIASVYEVCNKYFDDEVDKRIKVKNEGKGGKIMRDPKEYQTEIKSKDKQNSKTWNEDV